MKTRVLLAVTLLVGLAATAQAAIVGTKHDLSSTTTNSVRSTNVDQTCAFCHAPHNAQTNKLLWSRTAVAGSMKIYTSYNTGAMRTALGATNNALGTDSSSLLCLSCHSLATAADVINGTANGKGGTPYSGTMSALTTNMNNLTNDHPVGINYDAAYGISGAAGLTASTAGTGGQVVTKAGTTLRLFKSAINATSTMECATCHDVHGNASGYPKFLAGDPAASKLCTTCHVK